MSEDKLLPCPCDIATTCLMDEPCRGCEVYSEWLQNTRPEVPVEEIATAIHTTRAWQALHLELVSEILEDAKKAIAEALAKEFRFTRRT